MGDVLQIPKRQEAKNIKSLQALFKKKVFIKIFFNGNSNQSKTSEILLLCPSKTPKINNMAHAQPSEHQVTKSENTEHHKICHYTIDK